MPASAMPATIPDLAWYVSTALIVMLMAIISTLLGAGFALLLKKLDHLTSKMEIWINEITDIRSEMKAHRAICDERHKEAA